LGAPEFERKSANHPTNTTNTTRTQPNSSRDLDHLWTLAPGVCTCLHQQSRLIASEALDPTAHSVFKGEIENRSCIVTARTLRLPEVRTRWPVGKHSRHRLPPRSSSSRCWS
jgi:hypothetical protein